MFVAVAKNNDRLDDPGLGNSLTSDNAEPLNRRSGSPQAGLVKRSEYLATAIRGGNEALSLYVAREGNSRPCEKNGNGAFFVVSPKANE